MTKWREKLIGTNQVSFEFKDLYPQFFTTSNISEEIQRQINRMSNTIYGLESFSRTVNITSNPNGQGFIREFFGA